MVEFDYDSETEIGLGWLSALMLTAFIPGTLWWVTQDIWWSLPTLGAFVAGFGFYAWRSSLDDTVVLDLEGKRVLGVRRLFGRSHYAIHGRFHEVAAIIVQCETHHINRKYSPDVQEPLYYPQLVLRSGKFVTLGNRSQKPEGPLQRATEIAELIGCPLMPPRELRAYVLHEGKLKEIQAPLSRYNRMGQMAYALYFLALIVLCLAAYLADES